MSALPSTRRERATRADVRLASNSGAEVDMAQGPRSARKRHLILNCGVSASLYDAITNVVDRVVSRHLLLLQEIYGVALALSKDRDQHVGASHLITPGRLHMDDGALDHAMKCSHRPGLAVVDDQHFRSSSM